MIINFCFSLHRDFLVYFFIWSIEIVALKGIFLFPSVPNLFWWKDLSGKNKSLFWNDQVINLGSQVEMLITTTQFQFEFLDFRVFFVLRDPLKKMGSPFSCSSDAEKILKLPLIYSRIQFNSILAQSRNPKVSFFTLKLKNNERNDKFWNS